MLLRGDFFIAFAMDQKVLEILEELEAVKRGRVKFWNIPKSSAEFLNKLILLAKCKRVLEIGTSNGYSGIYLAEALSHTEGLLYTIESHEGRFDLARENFKKSGLENYVKQVFGHAPEIFDSLHKDLDLPWDLIFIDATKIEYVSYLDGLLPKLRVGGVMVADNCISHGKGLGPFFDFVDSQKNLRSVLLPFDNGLLMAVKISD